MEIDFEDRTLLTKDEFEEFKEQSKEVIKEIENFMELCENKFLKEKGGTISITKQEVEKLDSLLNVNE